MSVVITCKRDATTTDIQDFFPDPQQGKSFSSWSEAYIAPRTILQKLFLSLKCKSPCKTKERACSLSKKLRQPQQQIHGGPGGPAPLAPKFFFKSHFSGNFKGKNPILSKFWVQALPLGLKPRWAFLTKILDPSLNLMFPLFPIVLSMQDTKLKTQLMSFEYQTRFTPDSKTAGQCRALEFASMLFVCCAQDVVTRGNVEFIREQVASQ